MGVVMIRCPTTERVISTGMSIDSAAFHSMPVFFGTTFCPLCHISHEWFAASAWVCDCGPENCDPTCERCKMTLRKGSPRHHSDEGRVAILRDEDAPHVG
jgi:hypothetical protein